ncbi:hypothetical protein DERF_013536 [Dermatophagoides farinae]|uniref:Uncharacterized protein n=1 Tax=Dermatophagoides farinae TaxID=6954 RepID=A0A922HMC8_DERFA|nr:hypothetical protein DERF_013536 [Dermatophagoides farinae]
MYEKKNKKKAATIDPEPNNDNNNDWGVERQQQQPTNENVMAKLKSLSTCMIMDDSLRLIQEVVKKN